MKRSLVLGAGVGMSLLAACSPNVSLVANTPETSLMAHLASTIGNMALVVPGGDGSCLPGGEQVNINVPAILEDGTMQMVTAHTSYTFPGNQRVLCAPSVSISSAAGEKVNAAVYIKAPSTDLATKN